MFVFYLLKETLISLSFLNQTPYTTLAKYTPEARSFRLKPRRFDELLDLIVEGKYQNLRLLKKLAISVFDELEAIYEGLGRRLYDDSPHLKIENNW